MLLRLWLERVCRSSWDWRGMLSSTNSWRSGEMAPGARLDGFMRSESQSIDLAPRLLVVDAPELESTEEASELALLGRCLWWYILSRLLLMSSSCSLLSSCLRLLWLRKLRRKRWW